MDPSVFQNLLSQLDKEHFSDGKKSAVRSYLQQWFSGPQVAAVITKVTFDKTEILQMISPRMTYITGPEGKAIVDCFVHASEKVEAVRLIASRINDPVNKYAVLESIKHHFDKEDCRKLLDAAVPSVAGGCGNPPPCGGYQQGYPTPGAQPPGAYPQGQIGMPGISMNFNPGGFGVSMSVQPSPPGGPNYGACPPGQQANYPPQAGGPPPQNPYPPPGGAFPQANYPPQAGGPPPQNPYPPPGGTFPQAGYPPSQNPYPSPGGAFPQANYPPQAGGPPPQNPYPPPGGAFPQGGHRGY